jgi:hypothetical protein
MSSCLAFCQEAGQQAKLGNWQNTLTKLVLALDFVKDSKPNENDGIYKSSLKLRILNNIAIAKYYLSMDYCLEIGELPPVSKDILAFNLGRPTDYDYLIIGSLLNRFKNDSQLREQIKSSLQGILDFNQVYQIMGILDQVHNQTKVLDPIDLGEYAVLGSVINALIHSLNARYFFYEGNAVNCCNELYLYYTTKRQIGLSPEEIKIYMSNLALINEILMGKSQLAAILSGDSV